MKLPKCTGKNYNCGRVCLPASKNCPSEVDSNSDVYDFIELVVGLLSEEKRKKNSGAGSASLTKEEVQKLTDRKSTLIAGYDDPQQIVNSSKRQKIEDDLVSAIYDSLPSEVRAQVNKKGSLAAADYWDPETDAHGKPTAARGKFILKLFLEQDGLDAYTGLPLNWSSTDLEHVQPYGKLKERAEIPSNMVLTSQSVNQTKKEKSMSEFFEREVDPKASWTDEQWANQSADLLKQAQKVDALQQLVDESEPTPELAKQLGSKYYYLNRKLGLSTGVRKGKVIIDEQGRPTTRSAGTLPSSYGKPLLELAMSVKDNPTELEKVRVLSASITKSLTDEHLGLTPKGSAKALLEGFSLGAN